MLVLERLMVNVCFEQLTLKNTSETKQVTSDLRTILIDPAFPSQSLRAHCFYCEPMSSQTLFLYLGLSSILVSGFFTKGLPDAFNSTLDGVIGVPFLFVC